MAVVINIRNWFYYYIKIEEMATGISSHKQVKVLDCVIGVILLMSIVFASVWPFLGNEKAGRMDFYHLIILSGFYYFILSLVYAIIGVLILRRLKNRYNSFYK